MRVVEIELARQADDDGAVGALDAGDGILSNPGGPVRSSFAALGHER
jgi:hypothetical protein